jgi:hypothetical protein
MKPITAIAKLLTRRYSKQYPNRWVGLRDEDIDGTMNVFFRHANEPCRIYCRIVVTSKIELLRYHGNIDEWLSNGIFHLEDPDMFKALDEAVLRIVSTTPRLEEEGWYPNKIRAYCETPHVVTRDAQASQGG